MINLLIIYCIVLSIATGIKFFVHQNCDVPDTYFLYVLSIDIVQAKYAYRPNLKAWVKVHEIRSSWDEANAKCKSEDAVLASPTHLELLKEIKTLISLNGRHNKYYIGTRASQYDFGQDRPYLSIEGIELEDMPVSDMLAGLDSRQGECLSMDVDSIQVVPCWTRMPYICYSNATACRGDYVQFESLNNCYKLHQDLKIFEQAEATCIAEGGHLVVLDDTNEVEAIRTLNLTSSYPHTYVGLQAKRGNGDWTSIHGQKVEELYNVWTSGRKPSDINYKCATIHSNGKLEDYSCTVERAFICEKLLDNH